VHSRRRLLLLLFVVVCAGALGWTARKPLFYGILTVFGNPKCTVRDVLASKANRGMGGDVEKALLARMRRVRTEPGGFELWETPDGPYWVPRGHLLAHNLSEQERGVYEGDARQRVHPGDVVIDCGANVGLFTRRALKAGAKFVVAVEPSPENLVCLRRNFEAEVGAGTVQIVPKGVFDHEGELGFRIIEDNTTGNRFVVNPTPTQAASLLLLPITTIDRLVEELPLARVDFIKMDIEGSEQYAMKGALQTIKRFRPRMAISVYHRRTDADTIPALVTSADSGYRMQCGACSFSRRQRRLAPEIMFFN